MEFTVDVSDLDQEDLTFTTTGLPNGATLTQTGVYGKAIFKWTPTTAALGTRPVTIKVIDSGNGNAANGLADEETFNLVVRSANNAPILSPIGDISVAEAQTLSFNLSASDADGDKLIYSAANLPSGAVLDPETGILSWKPSFFAAGTYNNIQIIANDGNRSSRQTFSINVTNSNRAPVLAPIAPQSGRENASMQFFLKAGDIDRDVITYSAINPLPQGASLNAQTGEFSWKPNYNQAGDYLLKFAATDSSGATDVKEVAIAISNVNRTPSLKVSPQIVALGETLQFNLIGSDSDGNTLTYSAFDLPTGATLNTQTGAVTFQPTPGQVGEYLIIYGVSDGIDITTKNALIKVETTPTLPTVTLDFTPSFPAIPGQPVVIRALADSYTDISNLSLSVNGQTLALDGLGRATFVAPNTGRFEVLARATDAAGRVGQTSKILKVYDPTDSNAPIVNFAPGLEGAKITSLTDIVGTISDRNLDEWVLSISDIGENQFRTLATGKAIATNQSLTQFDPSELSNGFYQLQLQATDLKGRTSTAQILVEVNRLTKSSQYSQSQTDLILNLGGTAVNLVRRYDSLSLDEIGSFGYGWQLANLETDLQTNVPTTGKENLGVYNPFEAGTRLYLTLPDGKRAGFTFAPIKREITGLTYYTPAWVADAGVNYTLTSAEILLSKAGNRFYDLQSAQPYNPVATQKAFSLTAPDGTIYHLNGKGEVIEQVATNGTRLFYSDSGITASTGEMVRFVKDAQGRLTQITAPDGTAIVYSYDKDGRLIGARNLAIGASTRYGYSQDGLSLIAGEQGKAIAYSNTPVVSVVTADLGSAARFTGAVVEGNLAGSDRYSFSIRDSELRSTATGFVLLAVEVEGIGNLPIIQGLTPVASQTATESAFALFAIQKEGLNLLILDGNGNYSLRLSVAGDLNRDGLVDGVDSQLLMGAIETGNYRVEYDLNRDRVLDAADVQILGSNYGFSANRAPSVTGTSVLTHEDLGVSIDLEKLAVDPEGDEIFWKAVKATHGTVTFEADGVTTRFKPDTGYVGMASFELIADDGFGSSMPAVVTVKVSDAPLIDLDFVKRNPQLKVGERTQLVAIGDFADQKDVILSSDYLRWKSENGAVASVSDTGLVTGLSDGTTIF
ncbi:MAG: tandem-95 repeat protein [Hydrococcus sp. RM1_1_31]|nr:tandem-95 repeat protein [Hydrococcus sp. RM1_1_31]